jgi:hypothetical protein
MQKAFALPNWLRFGVGKTWSRLSKNKPGIAVVSALILVVFGDTLLPFFWHILHLAIEVIEMMAEQFLEHVFGVTPRQAEFIVFWTGITVAGTLVWRLASKAYRAITQACASVTQNWCAKTGPAKLVTTLKLAFLLSILGKTMLLFV